MKLFIIKGERGKRKFFLQYRQLKKFISSKPSLKKILEAIYQIEERSEHSRDTVEMKMKP